MAKLSYKISYYVLYLLFAVTIVVLLMFYLGGQMDVPLVADQPNNPANTDALIFLLYGLVGLTVAATVAAFVVQFVSSLMDNAMAALKSLIPIVLLVVILIIAWGVGSKETLSIPGYNGSDNSNPFWLKMTDMLIYTLYTLIAVNIVGMVLSGIKRRIS